MRGGGGLSIINNTHNQWGRGGGVYLLSIIHTISPPFTVSQYLPTDPQSQHDPLVAGQANRWSGRAGRGLGEVGSQRKKGCGLNFKNSLD